ncbi:MAG TPA: asparagine synthase-related protein [Polyangiaceae bacterium]|nr:asparagine synthase-related protein [Polyangiaceae bacterium]
MSAVCAVLGRSHAPDGLLSGMLARLTHLGPHGAGQYVDGPAGLAHARLATTEEDLLAAQPLLADDGRLVIAADARLDNRDDLFAAGASASRDVSDAELILWAYDRWGESCPEHLVGDFAFVVWDRDRRRVFAARDHLGVRSLYYYYDDTLGFRCASEMHALFADGCVARRAHRASLALFLLWEYNEQHQTLYRDVFALPPAHALTVSDGPPRLWRYWKPDPWRSIQHPNDEAHAAHFRDVLTEAVRCRLRARCPVAAEVSGGLDSSAVIGLCESLRRSGRSEAVTLVTTRYPGMPGVDESEWSDAVADYWRLPLVSVSAAGEPERRAPDLRILLPDFYYDAGILDTVRELDACKQRGIGVILTGMGGDQLLRRTGHEITALLRRGKFLAALEVAGLRAQPASLTAWNDLVRAILPVKARALVRRLRGRPIAPPWLMPELAREVESRETARDARSYPTESQRWHVERLTHGLDVLLGLSRIGRLGAARGIEFRHPFFDVRVIEHLLALPDEQRAAWTFNKPVLRRALGPDLPPAIHERRVQQNTASYYEQAFLKDHGPAVRQLLLGGRLEADGIVDGSEVRRMLETPVEFVHQLHTMVSLELWLRQSIPEIKHPERRTSRTAHPRA